MGSLLLVGWQDLVSTQSRNRRNPRLVALRCTSQRSGGSGPPSMLFMKSPLSPFSTSLGHWRALCVNSYGILGELAGKFPPFLHRRNNRKGVTILVPWRQNCNSSSSSNGDSSDETKKAEMGLPPLPEMVAVKESLGAQRPTVYHTLKHEMVTVNLFPELNFPLSGNFYPKLVPLIARKIVGLLREANSSPDGEHDRVADLLKLLGVRLTPHIVGEVIKQLRDPAMAKAFLEWAKTQPDFESTSHAYNQILWSVVNQRNGFPGVEYACQLVQEMLAKDLKPAPRACNLLVDRLCKDARIDEAVKVMNVCKSNQFPDVVTYNCIISGLGKLGLVGEAFEQFKAMKEMGCAPNVITYNSVINGFTKAGLMGQVFELFNEMTTTGGCAADRITYNTLIYGLCNAGRWQEAYEIWDEFPQRGIVPDVVTYNSLISGLFKCQRPGEALELFRAMGSRDRCKPDLITFNTVIDGLMQAGLTDEARKVLGSIEEHGCTANEITYNAMIIGLLNNNQRSEVSRFMELMKENGCEPSGYAQRLLRSALAENGGGRDIKGASRKDGKPRIKMPL